MKFKCIRKCFYNNRLFMVGEILLIDKTEVCGKCNGVDSNKCLYCKGTGIGDPPHHFREECEACGGEGCQTCNGRGFIGAKYPVPETMHLDGVLRHRDDFYVPEQVQFNKPKENLLDIALESKSNGNEEIALLRNEIESLGSTYDRRWSIGSLQKHILLLKKDKKEA